MAVAFVNTIINPKIPGIWATSLRVVINFSSIICNRLPGQLSFCTMAPNTCVLYVWNMLHVT